MCLLLCGCFLCRPCFVLYCVLIYHHVLCLNVSFVINVRHCIFVCSPPSILYYIMLPLLSHIWPHTSAFIPSFLLLLLLLTRLSSDLPVPLVLVPPIFSLFVSCRPVLSPQICIRASSQGLRLLCLLTCSSLSQVKSDPTSKACSFALLPFLSSV